MKAVRLNQRLALETPERLADGAGGYSINWRRLGWLWAELESGAGRARRAQFGPQSVVRWRVTLRAAAAGDPRRPAPGQRFRLGRRIFRIEAVAERDRAGRWLDCYANEEVGI